MGLHLEIYVISKELYDVLLLAFHDLESVTVHRGSICSTSVDCLIAPGNSFGFMDGGADRAINSWMTSYSPLGPCFAEVVKGEIHRQYYGDLPVGSCILVNAPREAPVKFVAYAPTMRVPESVSHTLNAYLAMRAALVSVRNCPYPISTIACTPLCTGAGKMPPSRAAAQMREAWDAVARDGPTTWSEAWKGHRALMAL
jgi:O-acetyl-ADP-ribose deacetylase (regulator of RNase III)